ncbi:MAG: TIGR01777 family oxidoreductase [Armatimonadetes bacterium]|nr:TIGR01777 family oxidoreductase [Armatimonadota bacterium]
MDERRLGHVVIAGGSGFIGTAITHHLENLGYSIVVLTRSPQPTHDKVRYGLWDGVSVGDWKSELEGAAAVINLSGSTIATRFTAKNLRKIIDSRVDPTRTIGQALSQVSDPPPIWIQGSAIGYYGFNDDSPKDETNGPEQPVQMLTNICQLWEDAAYQTCPSSVRLKVLRTGNVYGIGGGTYPFLGKLTQLYLGGHIMPGTQMQSWIHLTDLAHLFGWLLQDNTPALVNGTAPNPCTMRRLMEAMRESLDRPWAPPTPLFAVRLASYFGGPDASLVEKGSIILPKAALDAGFEYSYPTIELALKNLAEKSA